MVGGSVLSVCEAFLVRSGVGGITALLYFRLSKIVYKKYFMSAHCLYEQRAAPAACLFLPVLRGNFSISQCPRKMLQIGADARYKSDLRLALVHAACVLVEADRSSIDCSYGYKF
jgi:hypothetical protein